MDKIIYLVRHGKTGYPWDPDLDCGLNQLGLLQAEELAKTISNETHIPIISSPLRRAQESAAILAKRWESPIIIDTRVGEIPFPQNCSIPPMDWLKEIMNDNWVNLDSNIIEWKKIVAKCIMEQDNDCIIFTHYLTIAAFVSEVKNILQVDSFQSSNCELIRVSIRRGTASVDRVNQFI